MGWETHDEDVRRDQEQQDACDHQWEGGDKPNNPYRCAKCGSVDYERYNPRPECSHVWDEESRDALGYDGGGYHDGLGQRWYSVVERCRKCGAIRSGDTT
jgi:hypothetical protein